jgi:hypothetical protein
VNRSSVSQPVELCHTPNEVDRADVDGNQADYHLFSTAQTEELFLLSHCHPTSRSIVYSTHFSGLR